ncbi:Tryptophan synthase alpha chain [Minicystis rosea]|nr:Tryptophan synthase alpha chain [Minicystis rosea]
MLFAAFAGLSLFTATGCKTSVNGGGTGGTGATASSSTGGTIADGGSCGIGGSWGDGGSSGGDGTSTGNGGSGGQGSGCVAGGCSGQLCVEENSDIGTTCEWQEVYACFHAFGVCERGAGGECGWRQTKELEACIDADGRLPATGQCVRNAGDACSSDDDCSAGGCGGEVCFNPSLSSGVSTCDCTTPAKASCGCVEGKCAWWKDLY